MSCVIDLTVCPERVTASLDLKRKDQRIRKEAVDFDQQARGKAKPGKGDHRCRRQVG